MKRLLSGNEAIALGTYHAGVGMVKIDVLMAGVGGQGIILASDALAEVAMRSGYDVKKSDSLGMAQRGGSVTSHVRLGERVFSPMIKRGDADFLLALERLEAARWADYLGPAGVAVVNDQAFHPSLWWAMPRHTPPPRTSRGSSENTRMRSTSCLAWRLRRARAISKCSTCYCLASYLLS